MDKGVSRLWVGVGEDSSKSGTSSEGSLGKSDIKQPGGGTPGPELSCEIENVLWSCGH